MSKLVFSRIPDTVETSLVAHGAVSLAALVASLVHAIEADVPEGDGGCDAVEDLSGLGLFCTRGSAKHQVHIASGGRFNTPLVMWEDE